MPEMEVRQTAYQLAVRNDIENLLESWSKNEVAGMEWFLGLRSRYPSLSLRKTESCSLGYATAFNRNNVDLF